MDFSTYSVVLVLAFLSGMTTLLGVGLAYLCKKSYRFIVVGIGFAAGIMILVSVFELIPEAVRSLGVVSVLIAEAVGVLLAVLLNRIIPHTHLIEEKHHLKRARIAAAYLIAFGLILHDFPEGFAMANSYAYSASLGILVALTIALHNIPEEFAMAVPLIAAGKSKKTILKFAIWSGLAEPAGALLGLVAVQLFIGINTWLLAVAAGIMVYVAIHELWPMARQYKKPGMLALGFILSVIIFMLLVTILPK